MLSGLVSTAATTQRPPVKRKQESEIRALSLLGLFSGWMVLLSGFMLAELATIYLVVRTADMVPAIRTIMEPAR
jgi:hypothetical protein